MLAVTSTLWEWPIGQKEQEGVRARARMTVSFIIKWTSMIIKEGVTSKYTEKNTSTRLVCVCHFSQ